MCVCVCARTAVHAAAYSDRSEALQLLLSSGGDIGSIDILGRTPLMYSAMVGRCSAIGSYHFSKFSLLTALCLKALDDSVYPLDLLLLLEKNKNTVCMSFLRQVDTSFSHYAVTFMQIFVIRKVFV